MAYTETFSRHVLQRWYEHNESENYKCHLCSTVLLSLQWSLIVYGSHCIRKPLVNCQNRLVHLSINHSQYWNCSTGSQPWVGYYCLGLIMLPLTVVLPIGTLGYKFPPSWALTNNSLSSSCFKVLFECSSPHLQWSSMTVCCPPASSSWQCVAGLSSGRRSLCPVNFSLLVLTAAPTLTFIVLHGHMVMPINSQYGMETLLVEYI